MSLNELIQLAQREGMPHADGLDRQALIAQLLDAQSANSSFFSLQDTLELSEENDASGFITQDEASAFMTGSEEESGFISAEESGFISESEQNSGFIVDLEAGELKQKTGMSKSMVHQLGQGDSLQLNGRTYFITEIISQSSGEAVIYKVKDEAGGVFALKLYREARNTKREPNAEALERIRQIEHEDILKLHDFGTGEKKYLNKYCFEISAFARGGDLLSVPDFKEKYNYFFILNQVVPQLFKGIQVLHERNIYHCDLKPQNVFYLDTDYMDLVIGDYGSAKTFEEGSQLEHKKYSEVIGTKTYLAPEQATGIISEKNDYYAFGMILLHLMYPEAIASDDDPRKIDREKLHKINEKQYEQVRIYPFPEENRKINQLIEGLTLYNAKHRWGKEEVARWLAGEHVSVTYHAQSVVKPIKLGWATIRMPEDLIRAVEQHSPKEWYADLIQDEINFRSLLLWLNDLRDARQRKAFQKMVMHYQDEQASGVSKEERVAYIKEAIIRFFDPYRPLRLGGESFDFTQGKPVWEEVAGYLHQLDRFWKQVDTSKLRFSLFKFEFALRQAEMLCHGERREHIRQLLDAISDRIKVGSFPPFDDYRCQFPKIFAPGKRKDMLVYKTILHLQYLFDPKRGFQDHENQYYHSLRDVGLFFARKHGLFGDKIIQLEKAFFLNSIDCYSLQKLGYEGFLFEVFKDEVKTQFEIVDVKLESDRQVVFRYKYYKTLADFFARAGIDNQLIRAQTGIDSYTVKKGLFQGAGAVFREFLAGVKRQRNIPDSVFTAENIQSLKKKVRRKLWMQGFLLHSVEWLGALLMLIPFAGGAGLFLLKNQHDVSLAEQIFQLSALDQYVADPEANFNTVAGFYLIYLFFLGSYLLGVIPRIWCGSKLALWGKVYESEPDMLALSTSSVVGLFLLMLFAPAVFSFSNWLWEWVGWGMLLAMALSLMLATGRLKAKVLGALVVVAVLLRVLLMVDQGVENHQGRGLIDLGLYVGIFALALLPPLVYQQFKAHSTPYFSMKVVILAALLAFAFPMKFQIGSFYKQNWLVQPFELPAYAGHVEAEQLTDIIAGKFIARIKNKYLYVNIRRGRSVNTEVVRTMPRGKEFMITPDTENNWWLVESMQGEVLGYMHNSMIENLRPATKEDVATLHQP